MRAIELFHSIKFYRLMGGGGDIVGKNTLQKQILVAKVGIHLLSMSNRLPIHFAGSFASKYSSRAC